MSGDGLDEREALGVDEIVRRLPKFFTIACCSCRNSGKSVLITQLVKLLMKARKVGIVVVMSGSAGLNSDWNFIDPRLVMAFSEEKLARIAEKQEEDILAFNSPEGKDKPKPPKHVLVVLDDCLSTPEALESPTVASTFTLGRHKHMSCILISQHTTKFPNPILRANSDMLLYSRLNLRSLESLWYSTSNISKKDFVHLSQTLGGVDFSFILVDLYNRTSRDPADTITVIRADPPGKKH